MPSVLFTRKCPSVNGYVNIDVLVGYAESYDADANRTTVTLTGVQIREREHHVGSVVIKGSVRINGATICSFSPGTSSGTQVNLSTSYSTIPGSTGSALVEHNEDGTGSFTLTLAEAVNATSSFTGCFGYKDPGYKVGILTPANRTVALTAQPRASAILSCAAAAETLESCLLVMEKRSPSYRHAAVFSCLSDTLYTSELFDSSLSFTVPRSWFAAYPTRASLPVTVSVQTYNAGGDAVGAPVTAAMTVTADALMRPKLSAGWAVLTPLNTGAVAGLSGYIRGFSRAAAAFDPTKIDMSDAVGASIASYSVSCQGATDGESPYLTGVLGGGSAAVVCTVTDSRGRSASESFVLPVMDCAAPQLTEPAVFRCGANGAADDEGSRLSVCVRLSYSPLDGQNACTLSAAFAAAGGSYGPETALVSGTPAVLGPVSPDLSYVVRITAADAVGGTAAYYETIPTRRWAMKFRPDGSGVAFGKAAETDGRFEVTEDWDAVFGGDVEIGGDADIAGGMSLGTPLPVSSGGTGADSAAGARAALGIASPVRYYPAQVVAAASNAEILRITDASITADTVCIGCVFADPAYVSGDVTWQSGSGYIAFTGTVTAATAADVILAKKGN